MVDLVIYYADFFSVRIFESLPPTKFMAKKETVQRVEKPLHPAAFKGTIVMIYEIFCRTHP